MQKKILLGYIVIILLAIGISATTFWSTGYKLIEEDNNQKYLKQADLIADSFSLTEINNYNDIERFAIHYSDKYNVRITVIDLDGNVIIDSYTQGPLENHGN